MINQAAIRARSWLFTPATRPDRFANAAAVGADVVILDLEDAVAPKDKAQARTTALDYLAGNPADGALHALRINGLDTRSGISDLDALLGSRAAPNFLVLPKTETAGHLNILERSRDLSVVCRDRERCYGPGEERYETKSQQQLCRETCADHHGRESG
jgi:(S)-citramalyl-CoA lyase